MLNKYLEICAKVLYLISLYKNMILLSISSLKTEEINMEKMSTGIVKRYCVKSN